METLHQSLSGATAVVITRQSGMTVAEVTDLRRQMRAAGASFKVTKNRLARLALKGTRFEGLGGLFTGPTAIAYSEDPVAAAKVVSDFANSNNKLMKSLMLYRKVIVICNKRFQLKIAAKK